MKGSNKPVANGSGQNFAEKQSRKLPPVKKPPGKSYPKKPKN